MTFASKIIRKDTVHLVISNHCSTFLGALGSFSKPAFSLGIVSQWSTRHWLGLLFRGTINTAFRKWGRLGETGSKHRPHCFQSMVLPHCQGQSGMGFFCGQMLEKVQKYRKKCQKKGEAPFETTENNTDRSLRASRDQTRKKLLYMGLNFQ